MRLASLPGPGQMQMPALHEVLSDPTCFLTCFLPLLFLGWVVAIIVAYARRYEGPREPGGPWPKAGDHWEARNRRDDRVQRPDDGIQ